MTAITFDTLKFANRLKQAGVAPTHAEAEAQALAEVFEINLGDLATKGDLLAVKADVQAVKIEVQHLEQRMTIKLGRHNGGGSEYRSDLGEAVIVRPGNSSIVARHFGI